MLATAVDARKGLLMEKNLAVEGDNALKRALRACVGAGLTGLTV